mmetsp:Transcript_99855/g.238000  ORF Transcript_99855/g.238000 Transcript_99855/m.238000 type:complete len:96 (+) Transcript_99855:1102-1389(+)
MRQMKKLWRKAKDECVQPGRTSEWVHKRRCGKTLCAWCRFAPEPKALIAHFTGAALAAVAGGVGELQIAKLTSSRIPLDWKTWAGRTVRLPVAFS